MIGLTDGWVNKKYPVKGGKERHIDIGNQIDKEDNSLKKFFAALTLLG